MTDNYRTAYHGDPNMLLLLESLPLPQRMQTFCKNHNVVYLGELLAVPTIDFKQAPNIGPKTLQETQDVLDRLEHDVVPYRLHSISDTYMPQEALIYPKDLKDLKALTAFFGLPADAQPIEQPRFKSDSKTSTFPFTADDFPLRESKALKTFFIVTFDAPAKLHQMIMDDFIVVDSVFNLNGGRGNDIVQAQLTNNGGHVSMRFNHTASGQLPAKLIEEGITPYKEMLVVRLNAAFQRSAQHLQKQYEDVTDRMKRYDLLPK
jgi:hypothetical protein